MVAAIVPGKRSAPLDPAFVQAEVLRFADDFMGRTTVALEDYARRVNTPEARRDALRWKLSVNSSVLTIATGPNPAASLFDLVALASVARAFLEVRAVDAEPPGALEPWLAASRLLETNAWAMAGNVLTAEQQEELRVTLTQWCRENPGTKVSFFERPRDVAWVIRQSGAERRSPGSVFTLIGLDPTAGLDPAVREVTRTRLFAERALYAAERFPYLVRWQTEALTDDVLRQPPVASALQSADRLSRAAESASTTAASLPDRIRAEREAIVEALEGQEGKLRALSAEVGQTLSAGERMSTSLHTTLVAFDALMKRFGVGEPPRGPPETNAAPFDILDYARTAEQIATMAQRMDDLIRDAAVTLDSPALDQRVADLNALSARARADVRSVLNHAFSLMAGLILLGFACAMVYRRTGARGG